MAARGSKTPRRAIIRIAGIRGTLTWKGERVSLTWSIRVSATGRVTIDFRPVSVTQTTAWLLHVPSDRGRFATWAAIDGVAPDGRRVRSDHVYLSSREDRIGPHSAKVKITGEIARLTVFWEAPPKTSKGLRAIYQTVGMQGFHLQRAPTAAGEVLLAAPAQIGDFDEIAGRVDVVAPPKPKQFARWLKDADEVVERILDLVSLANGHLTRWSVRHVAHDTTRGKKIIVSEFYGPKATGRPHDGVGHFLDLQPWIDLAVKRYTVRLRNATGIDVAMQWLLFHPVYHEFQLLAAMTALEHLVSKHSRRSRGPTLVNRRTFTLLRAEIEPAFDKLLRQARTSGNTIRRKRLEQLRSKIFAANEGSFPDKLRTLLRAHKVPLVGIEADIQKAIAARHTVVHSGLYSGADSYHELYGHVVVLRELLKRIILSILGYVGQYHTMLHGSEHLAFPPPDEQHQAVATAG